jgi:hypothetical protein
MPSQENIKKVEVLLSSLSNLETYIDALKNIERGSSKENLIVVTIGTIKYIYGIKELKKGTILYTLIEQGNRTKDDLVKEINELLTT